MADIIQLLPDHIANQIAAGEVIQRPASVVKELLENSIDAQATEIKLIIKDSGKTLIQVIDNGAGMSVTDARMSFERHATSKIQKAQDLFSIRTKGFRGEALASIAAIAHVEMITRLRNEEIGHRILIHGSKVEKQEVVQASAGTKISVKNLFFNIPARRKFLKSDPVELKHVLNEFHRVVLAHPDLHFSLIHNENEVYHLRPVPLKQRILNVFGKSLDSKLLPINENTDLLKIHGFIGKADAAKKSSSDQFFFVNQRYIRSNYLSHAVKSGYEMLLQKDQYPVFFLFLDIDPSSIDVNVHPTKTEIKFDDERLIYNYLRVSTKHALGKYIVSPTLDFETDTNFIAAHSNTHTKPTGEKYKDDAYMLQKENLKSWEKIYETLPEHKRNTPTHEQLTLESDVSENDSIDVKERKPYQLHSSFIISHIKSGFLVIDQHYAHQRILYERNLAALNGTSIPAQKELFPIQIELEPSKAVMVNHLLEYLNKLGFDIGEFGKTGLIIHGTPSGMPENFNVQMMIEELFNQFSNERDFSSGMEERIAFTYSKMSAIKRGKVLNTDEMNQLIDDLFACETPFTTPSGKKTFITIEMEDIFNSFA